MIVTPLSISAVDAPISRPAISPRARDLIILFIVSLSVRALIAGVVVYQSGKPFADFARRYDGNSYLITARALLGDRAEFNDYHGRVFFGLPLALAALARVGIPLHIAGPLLNWLSASLAAVLAVRLFGDLRIGWAVSFLFPHTLMNSCLTMSESPMLALLLAGMVVLRPGNIKTPWSRALVAGLLVGMAMMFRPMACFGLAAVAGYELHRRHWKRAATLLATAGAVCLAGWLLQSHWRGDGLANLRYQATSPAAYGGRLLDWPFMSLCVDPFTRGTPLARILYIELHVAVVLLACALAGREMLKARQGNTPPDWRTTVAALWLAGNTAFQVCLGSPWGFECFHRFTLPAAPALWWFMRALLPQELPAWLAIATMSAAFAAATLLGNI